MSQYDYQMSQIIAQNDPPFYALIMAAARKADTDNLALLREAFPQTVEELQARYHAPGGVLPGEGDPFDTDFGPADDPEHPDFVAELEDRVDASREGGW